MVNQNSYGVQNAFGMYFPFLGEKESQSAREKKQADLWSLKGYITPGMLAEKPNMKAGAKNKLKL
jgi:hypothetical protein